VKHSDTNLATAADHHLELIPSPKRVRVMLGGVFIADSRRVLLLRERGSIPVYYFHETDLRAVLEPSPLQGHCPRKGALHYWHVTGGGVRRENGAWGCPEATIDGQSLAAYVAFDWNAMDAWFEEDEEVFFHPRDPFARIDVLQGSQHVQITLGGMTVAESRRPLLLFETGLPTRYYLPKPDVRMELLVPSDTRTHCPYKGEARYYSIKTGDTTTEDLFWYYPFPTLAMARIAGLLSFLPEKAGQVLIDGNPLL
jgi:uncharacterized protein (DUF427 family)